MSLRSLFFVFIFSISLFASCSPLSIPLSFFDGPPSQLSANNGPFQNPIRIGIGISIFVEYTTTTTFISSNNSSSFISTSSVSTSSGWIAVTPTSNAPSPVSTVSVTVNGNITAPVVLPNSRDSQTGCSPITGSSVPFTKIQDNGQPFNNTILLLQNGPCTPDVTGLGVVAVISAANGLFFFGDTYAFPVPLLNIISSSDAALLLSYVRSSVANTQNSSSSNSSNSSSSSSRSVVVATIIGTGPLVESERAALANVAAKLNYTVPKELLSSTFGPLSSYLFSPLWSSPSWDPCTSEAFLGGFYCEQGHIVSIVLRQYGLSGSFPDLSAFTHLRNLILSTNSLTGTVSSSSLCSLISLFHLDLSFNQITSVPDCFDRAFATATLNTVLLNNNQLHTFPLTMLATSETLMQLDMSNNLIVSFPSLANLVNLNTLILSSNNATGAIFDFSSFKSLQTLDLHANLFSGCLSSSFFDGLSLLSHVDLSFNSLCGVLPSFLNCTSLSTIALDSNQLRGDVPAAWTILPSLNTITASMNQITWPDTTTFMNNMVVTTLDFSSNNISIPAAFLTGGPASFLNSVLPSSIVSLALDNNKIRGFWETGYIGFFDYPFWSVFTISHNGLTNIPPDIFQNGFPPITYLDMSYNALSGSIPSTSPPRNMSFLSFSSNPGLSGPLPAWAVLSTVDFRVESGSSSSSASSSSSSSSSFACPSILNRLNRGMVFAVDARYTNYAGCYCVNGYYGTVPNCTLIPSSVSLIAPASTSSSSSSSLTLPSFNDSEFGNERFSAGIDTTWVLTPPSSSSGVVRVVSLNVTVFPLTFMHDTDIITVYNGASISAPVIMTLIGNTLASTATRTTTTTMIAATTSVSASSSSSSSSTQSSASSAIIIPITVLNQVAAVNFKSRDVGGAHFNVDVSYSYTCPSNFAVNPITNVCEQILPTFNVSASFQIAVYVASAVVTVIILAIGVVIIYYRNSLIIKSSSVPFCMLIVLFLVVMSIGSIFWALQPISSSSSVCHLRAWFTGMSVVGTLATLLTKANRIRVIFNNLHFKKELSISNWDLFRTLCMILLCESVLLITYSARIPLSSSLTVTGSAATAGYIVNECPDPTTTNEYLAWIIVQFVYVAVFLAAGLVIAFGIRKVPSAFNESSHIVNCLSILLTLGFIIVLVQFITASDPNALVVLRGVGQSMVSLVLALAIFGPKIYVIWDGRSDESALFHLPAKSSSTKTVDRDNQKKTTHKNGLPSSTSDQTSQHVKSLIEKLNKYTLRDDDPVHASLKELLSAMSTVSRQSQHSHPSAGVGTGSSPSVFFHPLSSPNVALPAPLHSATAFSFVPPSSSSSSSSSSASSSPVPTSPVSTLSNLEQSPSSPSHTPNVALTTMTQTASTSTSNEPNAKNFI